MSTPKSLWTIYHDYQKILEAKLPPLGYVKTMEVNHAMGESVSYENGPLSVQWVFQDRESYCTLRAQGKARKLFLEFTSSAQVEADWMPQLDAWLNSPNTPEKPAEKKGGFWSLFKKR
jgi:hypothetical protein